MNRARIGFTSGAMLFVALLAHEDPAHPLHADWMSFEVDTPRGVSVNEGTRVGTTGERYLDGKRSLLWTIEGDGEMIVGFPVAFMPKAQATSIYGREAGAFFSVWIYNEKAQSEGRVRIEFGKGKFATAECGFDFRLNFRGWRSCYIPFDEMEGHPVSGMDSIRFRCLGTGHVRRLFVDSLMVSYDDSRFPRPDAQVDLKTRHMGEAPYDKEIIFPLPSPVPAAGKDEISSLQAVETSLEESILDPWKDKKDDADSILKEYHDLELEPLTDGSTRGRHVILHTHRDMYWPSFLGPEEKARFDRFVDFRAYGSLMRRIAVRYRLESDAARKEAFRSMFLTMSRHLLDQGWARGSAQGPTHHWGYASREWHDAVFLMRRVPEFLAGGLYADSFAAQLWFAREFEKDLTMDIDGYRREGAVGICDYYNTLSLGHLMLLLATPEVHSRVALLKKFSAYLSATMVSIPVANGGGYKPDGTAFHHWGHYPAYAFGGFTSLSQIIQWLSGSPFALTPESVAIFKKTLLATRLYSNPTPGIGLSGRHPLAGPSVVTLKAAYLNQARTPPVQPEGIGKGGVDEVFASAYLRLFPEDRENAMRLFGKSVSPEPTPRGFWPFNYGGFGIHRWGEKMVTLKGYNRFVWNAEIYAADNRYGRYQSHGGIQIMDDLPPQENGYSISGWDWNLNPGATVIDLPLELLESPAKQTLMVHSEVRSSGASSLGGRYGAFNFHLVPPERPLKNWDPGFTARKSAFCFDDRIICLGSEISSTDREHPVVTVLFQHALYRKTVATHVDGKPVEDFPWAGEVGSGHGIIDGFGNGYVMYGADSVKIRRRHQISCDDHKTWRDKKVTEGDFAAAWIDHGPAPDRAGYEYMVLLDAKPKNMEEFRTDAKPYRVLRRDAVAHAVHDTVSGVTGITLFESGGDLAIHPIASVDSPALVLFKMEASERRMTMSVCDPDIHPTPAATAKTHRLTLEGSWGLVPSSLPVRTIPTGSRTGLEVTCVHGIPVEFVLEKN